jgi:hypothetical protein
VSIAVVVIVIACVCRFKSLVHHREESGIHALSEASEPAHSDNTQDDEGEEGEEGPNEVPGARCEDGVVKEGKRGARAAEGSLKGRGASE